MTQANNLTHTALACRSYFKANCASAGECLFIITIPPFACDNGGESGGIVCGNGVVDAGEQCDGEPGCNRDCTKGPCFGKNPGNSCDANGDGRVDGCCSEMLVCEGGLDTDGDGYPDICDDCACSNIPPTFTPKILLSTEYECGQGVSPVPNVSVADCLGNHLNITMTNPTNDIRCGGLYVREFTATSCGGTTTLRQTINIVDTTAPDSPTDFTTSFSCKNLVTINPLSASDICDGEVTGIYKDGLLENCDFNQTWSFTDECGNTATTIESIDVQDVTPPSLETPLNATFQCIAEITRPDASAIDNCGGFVNLTKKITRCL